MALKSQTWACPEESLLPWCCEESVCCEPDEAAIIMCDLCAQGATVSGNALEGSSANLACCIGGVWQFDGTGTITFAGGGEWDTIIVMGHTADTIATPLGTVPGLCETECGDFYAPAVFHGGLQTGGASITISGTGPQCVERIIVGKKLFFPEGLSLGYSDIFAGADSEMDVKFNECGAPISAMQKRSPLSLDVDIQCVSRQWAKELWSPARRYMAQHGVCFMPSVNLCPDDVFCGWLTSAVAAAAGPFYKNISLSAQGFIGVGYEK